jgi:hypothetical protein
MTVAYTAAGMGILIAGSILWLVRRDHMHGSHSLWWLAVAGSALVVGFAPWAIDFIGALLGVHYPPMLLVIGVLGALLIKLLQLDIETSRRERRMRRLIQKLAIMELELRELRDRCESSGQQGSTTSTLPKSAAVPIESAAARRKVTG